MEAMAWEQLGDGLTNQEGGVEGRRDGLRGNRDGLKEQVVWGEEAGGMG